MELVLTGFSLRHQWIIMLIKLIISC